MDLSPPTENLQTREATNSRLGSTRTRQEQEGIDPPLTSLFIYRYPFLPLGNEASNTAAFFFFFFFACVMCKRQRSRRPLPPHERFLLSSPAEERTDPGTPAKVWL